MKRWQKLNNLIPKNSPYRPSPPDGRDFLIYQLPNICTGQIPDSVMLDKPIPFVLNQQNMPWCVGAAGAGISNALYNNIEKMPNKGFSMRDLYWRCKERDGIPHLDGTYPSVALDVMYKEGILPENELPFINNNTKPIITDAMREIAQQYKIKGYARLYGLNQILLALASGKYVLIATIVTSANWKENTKDFGFLNLPEGNILGGHGTFLCGYDKFLSYYNFKGYLRGLNSWSDTWGEKGYYWMPFDYVDWEMIDLPGYKAFQEAWAIEFDVLPSPLPRKQTIEMRVGNPIAKIDYKEFPIDPINDKVTPIIINNRAMLPIRFVAEALRMNVMWNEKEKKVTLSGDKNIEMWIDSNITKVDGKEVRIDAPPTIAKEWSRTLVPIRFISENLGAKVDWDNDNKKVTITK